MLILHASGYSIQSVIYLVFLSEDSNVKDTESTEKFVHSLEEEQFKNFLEREIDKSLEELER